MSINNIFAISCDIGPDINIINSFKKEEFSGKKNFDIPPNGYRYIFFTSTFNNFAIKKCPSSCTIINVEIITKGINEAVKIANKANKYTNGFISKYLYIVFIV